MCWKLCFVENFNVKFNSFVFLHADVPVCCYENNDKKLRPSFTFLNDLCSKFLYVYKCLQCFVPIMNIFPGCTKFGQNNTTPSNLQWEEWRIEGFENKDYFVMRCFTSTFKAFLKYLVPLKCSRRFFILEITPWKSPFPPSLLENSLILSAEIKRTERFFI